MNQQPANQERLHRSVQARLLAERVKQEVESAPALVKNRLGALVELAYLVAAIAADLEDLEQ